MVTMGLCSVLVVAFSCVLKVGSHPTTSTLLATNPTSNNTIEPIHDVPHHHGPALDHGPHQHHSGTSEHGKNRTLTSLSSLIHHLLDKDSSHLTPVVQSFTDCVTACLHPKHPPHPTHPTLDDDDVIHDIHHHADSKDRHNNHLHPKRNHDHDSDHEDAADILSRIGELLRDTNRMASSKSHPGPAEDHPGPAGDHPGAAGGHLEDDDMNRYWMCSHTCMLTAGAYVLG